MVSAPVAHRASTPRAQPGGERQAAQVGRGLDVEAGGHRPDLLQVPLPVLVADHAGYERERVQQAEVDGYYPLAPWTGFAVLCGRRALALVVAACLPRRRYA